MGLFDVAKKAGNVLMENVGSQFPNMVCRKAFKCHDCGLIWYLPESITTDAKIIVAQPGHECTKVDGKRHWMRRIN